MVYESSITLSQKEINDINKALRIECGKLEEEEWDSHWPIAVAKFSNGYEIDIDLYSGNTNYFLDIVLFNGSGHEQASNCDHDEIPDAFEIHRGDDIYIVDVKIKKKRQNRRQ